MKILFSILSYRPSFISEEQINIGVLFHNIDTNEVRFDIITKWNRVEVFDDELDIKYFKLIIYGIKDHILKNAHKLDIENYIKRYNNEIRFSKIKVKETDEFENFVKDTKKIFLKYDYDKKHRLNKSEQKKYVRELFKDNNIEYSSKNIRSIYNDNINFDYIIGNQGIKIFSLKGKKASKMIYAARAWNQIAKQVEPLYQTILIHDIDKDDKEYETVLNILKDSPAKLISLENILDYLNTSEKQLKLQLF